MEIVLDKNMPVKQFNKHWQYCIGSDHAAYMLRADYVKQLKFIHDELGIKYVRFHGILNDDMHTLDTFDNVLSGMPDAEKYIERNFYLCGVAYDNVLECGMKPFVELSFMPNLLAKEKKTDKGFYGSNFSHPKNMNEWVEHIQAFVKYLLHRYGNEEVESWPFEVWNEPDLEGAFYLGTQEDYFNLYEATARAIKEVNPNISVGGPATSGSKWIESFVVHCKNHNIPLDFVSTHQYAGDPFTGIEDKGGPETVKEIAPNKEKIDKGAMLKKQMAKLSPLIPDGATCLDIVRIMFGDPSETKDMVPDVFKRNSEIVKQQARGLPVYYTEWNIMATLTARSNDMKKAAAYDIKTILDIEENVVGSSIWCFSDIFEEMHQFKEEFHGGFGLLTIHGIPKPSFYALKMMSALGDEQYVLKDNLEDTDFCIGAFKADGRKDLVITRQYMKQLDLPASEITIKVELEKKPTKVLVERIDDAHCNPLSIWEKNGSKADLTKKEVEEIKELSQMKKELLNYEYENGWINCRVSLKVNDVVHIQIIE